MRGLCWPVACQRRPSPDAPREEVPGAEALARPGVTDTVPMPPKPLSSCAEESASRSVMVTSVILPRRAAMVRVLTCTTRAMMVTSCPSTSSAKELSSPRGRYLRGKYSSIWPTVVIPRCMAMALALGAGRYFLRGVFSRLSSAA